MEQNIGKTMNKLKGWPSFLPLPNILTSLSVILVERKAIFVEPTPWLGDLAPPEWPLLFAGQPGEADHFGSSQMAMVK